MGGAYLSSWLINLRHCHSCTNFAKKTIEFLLHASIWLDNRFIFCTKMVDSEKRRPVRRTVYIPYQWQIDDSLFNFWHCRKLWLFQPALFLLFLFSYFILVIQAAYLWVCLVGMGDDHHEAIRYRLTTSDAWNFLQWYLNLGIRLEACYKAVHIALMTYLNVPLHHIIQPPINL